MSLISRKFEETRHEQGRIVRRWIVWRVLGVVVARLQVPGGRS